MPTVFVNKLIREILEPPLALEDTPKPTLSTKFPADLTAVVPIIVGRATTGSELDPRFGADFAVLQFDVYAADETTAQEWSAWVRDEVFEAYRTQTVYGQGHLSSFNTDQVPHRFPDQTIPDNLSRYMSQYRVGVKPP